MLALADAVILSGGWTRRVIAFGAGAFGALALAPLNVGPALAITMTIAVWLIDGASERRPPTGRLFDIGGIGSLKSAFAAGWWLGFGYFVTGFWWLGAAFLIDPQFAWALPLGVIGLPAILALFTGAGFVVARCLWGPGAPRILALALGLGLADWARGHLFTGFPWNSFGMGLGGRLVTAQFAALIGLDGLNLTAVALCAAPATLTDNGRRLRLGPTLLALVGLLAILAYGGLRLARPLSGDVPNVVVRIMQPGVRPDDTFIPQNRDKIVSHYLDLSMRDDPVTGTKLSDVTMLVWPESAFPFILTRDPDELAKIGAALPPKTTLVTGAAREESVPGADGQSDYSIYYNTIDVIAAGGTIVDSYDKIHLVPFGEYLPFNDLLRRLGLRNFVAIPGGFDPGHVRRPLAIPGLPPASPLVCYEAIFPGMVMPTPGFGSPRPGFLLNVTNDGWFGLTSGPSQHFAQARLRTIEEGLPMVRGAATGISAIVDPYGRIVTSLGLGGEGIIDGGLPRPIARPPFAKFGENLFWIVWLATFAALLAAKAVQAARPCAIRPL